MRFKKVLLPVLVLMLSLQSFSIAAQSNDSLVNELTRKWNNAEKYALQLAASMPEAEYDFRPSADEMTFREQLLHIAQNMKWLASEYLNVTKEPMGNERAKLSKAEVLSALGHAYQVGLTAHYKLQSEQLGDVVPFFSGPKTKRQIITLMHDHQTHHLGQLIVYIRLKGIKPPAYVGW